LACGAGDREHGERALIGRLLIAWCLIATTVIVHAAGLTFALRRTTRFMHHHRFWPVTGLIIQLAWWLIVVHMIEIAIWAVFYWGKGCLPDAESSFYFSGVTYATLGYGDIVLPQAWRLFGPLEGLTGILMCGLSTGFFFVVVSRMLSRSSDSARQA
jgi:hypothetical protein